MDKNKIIQAATKYVQKGQFDKAIKEYQRIVEDDPRDIRILLKIGELYQKRGENKEAAGTLLRVAEAYSADGFFLKAAAVYKQVLKLNPALNDVNLRLAELYQQLGLMNDAMQQFQLVAAAYEKAGNGRAALGLLKKLVELEPENVASRVRLAEAYSNESMTAEAVAELAQVAEQLKQSGRNEEFIKVAERLLFLDPGNSKLQRELANIYLSRGDTKRALAKLQICFKADPQDIDTLALLAQTFLDLGQQAKTISVYKELAKIYGSKGRREEEQATWQRVLSLVPDDAEALQATGGAPPVEEQIEEQIEEQVEEQIDADFDAEPVVEEVPEEVSAELEEDVVEPSAFQQAPQPRAVAPPPPARTQPPPSRASPSLITRAADVQKLLTETDVYLKYGLHEKAADHLRRILEASPDSLPAHLKARDLHQLTGDSAAMAEDLVNCVRLSLRDGNQPQAKSFFDQLLETDPEHGLIPELRASIGKVNEPPELDEDAAVLVEAEDLHEDTASISVEDQQLLVDEPGLIHEDEEPALKPPPPRSASKEAHVVAGRSSGSDEAILADPEEAEGSGDLTDEGLVEDVSEMDSAALVAVGFEPPKTKDPVLDDFLSSPDSYKSSPSGDGPAEVTDVHQLPPEFAEQLRRPDPPKPRVDPKPGPVASSKSKPAPPVTPPSAPPARSAPSRAAPSRSSPSAMATRVAPAPTRPAPPATPPPAAASSSAGDEPHELGEAKFFLEQGLLDEAEEVISTLRPLANKNPALRPKVYELEKRLAQARTPAAPAAHADNSFDLAHEIEEEVDKSGAAAADPDDFQYSVQDVLSDFKKGLEKVLKPSDVEAHYEMGIAYKEMGLLDEAVSEFETALRGAEGKPKEPDCLSMIGVCRAAKGELPQAVQAFERALRAKALKPEARLNLHFEIGAAKEGQGDNAGAAEAYEKVAKVDPAYRDVSAALARVQKPGSKPPPGKGKLNGHAVEAETEAEPTVERPVSNRSGKIGYV